MATRVSEEESRLQAARNLVPWKKWSPCLSERQWGTVREDYSETGNAWDYLSLWLAATGQTWSAVAMAGWGAGVVGTLDNVLRPMIAGRGVKIEGAALFVGMIGGMIAFGLVGLFLGPIALYAVRELVAILRRDIYAEPIGSA
jgi:hypothetical protein